MLSEKNRLDHADGVDVAKAKIALQPKPAGGLGEATAMGALG